MGKLKFWDDIRSEDWKLHEQRDTIISDVIQNLFKEIKNNPNVIDSPEVYRLQKKFSLFGTSIWKDKISISSHVIFGLKSGVVFCKYGIEFLTGNGPADSFNIPYLRMTERLLINGNKASERDAPHLFSKSCSAEDISILMEFKNRFQSAKEQFDQHVSDSFNKEHLNLKNKKNELKELRDKELAQLDKNGDGEIDLVDYLDFSKILQKNQSKISEIDSSYIHKFIKLSNYLKDKSNNIKSLYNSLKSDSKVVIVNENNYLDDEIMQGLIENEEQNIQSLIDAACLALENEEYFEKSYLIELNEEDLFYRVEWVKNLRNLSHSYDLMVFHSYNMLSSLLSGDLIAFYEIYEMFDKLSVFNSNWENEVALKLKNIEDKLEELIVSINEMENNIVKELKSLNYSIQDGFSKLSDSVSQQLQDIDSSIKWGNFISTIQAYQMYKMNKYTKSLVKK
jgi:hypothetical protein